MHCRLFPQRWAGGGLKYKIEHKKRITFSKILLKNVYNEWTIIIIEKQWTVIDKYFQQLSLTKTFFTFVWQVDTKISILKK